MNLHEGSLLQGGRYRIEKVLGQGGFGITYLGVQTNLEAKVAIKEFFMKDLCNRDSDTSQVTVGSVGSRETVDSFRQKFIKEARNIFRLKHRHIIPVIDVFEENGTAYYVMEHIGGGSLADKVRGGALPEEDAVRYTRQVADALAFVHSKRMMHLDVKPANILLDDNDNAVLIDFGLAKQYDTEGHQTSSTPVGISHGYAPLEQYKRGGVSTFSPATDIYSLGATLFKLVTGVTPPEASDVNDEGLPVLPSDISPAVRGAIEAAMEPRRKDRPQSVEEFLELLKGYKDLKDPKAFKDLSEETKAPEEELIDDADVEVTVLPDERVQITDNRVQRVNVKAIEAENEEPRAVEKEPEQVAVTNNEPSEPKKNRTAWVVAVVVLLGVLVGGGLFFAFSGGDSDNGSSNGGNDRLASHSNEPATTVVIEDTEEEAETPTIPAAPVVNTDSIVAARMQAYQDSINAANAAREAAEQQAAEEAARREREEAARLEREEAARREREEAARREREEAARLAREQQQGISTQKKVDLGLSVCWAGWNVGASSPEGYGNYYAWGETTTKSDYSESSYQYHNGSDYVNIGSNISGTRYDVARTQWGGSWRMPTKAEFEELINRCTCTWTTYNGVNGWKVTGPNGNSIFLPAAGNRFGTELYYRGSHGFYWSGSINEGGQSHAYSLYFYSGDRHVGEFLRRCGYTVRPVCNK